MRLLFISILLLHSERVLPQWTWEHLNDHSYYQFLKEKKVVDYKVFTIKHKNNSDKKRLEKHLEFNSKSQILKCTDYFRYSAKKSKSISNFSYYNDLLYKESYFVEFQNSFRCYYYIKKNDTVFYVKEIHECDTTKFINPVDLLENYDPKEITFLNYSEDILFTFEKYNKKFSDKIKLNQDGSGYFALKDTFTYRTLLIDTVFFDKEKNITKVKEDYVINNKSQQYEVINSSIKDIQNSREISGQFIEYKKLRRKVIYHEIIYDEKGLIRKIIYKNKFKRPTITYDHQIKYSNA